MEQKRADGTDETEWNFQQNSSWRKIQDIDEPDKWKNSFRKKKIDVPKSEEILPLCERLK